MCGTIVKITGCSVFIVIMLVIAVAIAVSAPAEAPSFPTDACAFAVFDVLAEDAELRVYEDATATVIEGPDSVREIVAWINGLEDDVRMASGCTGSEVNVALA